MSGLPTTVSNVETLANLPYIHQHGSQSFRAVGTPMSPGTFLATITGAGRPAALYEIPHGAAFSDLLTLHGVTVDSVRGVLMGGYFAGLVNTDILDATLDHETIRRLGSGLGLRCDLDPHRRLPGRCRGVGDVLLRPRERRPVRFMFQRHGGHGRRRLRAA